MSILYTQYWDVIPGKFDEYSTFVSNEFNPTLERLGINLLGGYYVAVGDGPRIVAVSLVEPETNLKVILSDREFRIIISKLRRLVIHYASVLWVPSGRIHEQPYKIHTGAWKFNQYYNIVPGQEEEHYRYVKETCIPGMKEIGLPLTGGWRMAIGKGPQILAEATGRNFENITSAINTSEFRQMVRTLQKNFALDYSSRILAPTGRIEIPYFIKQMMKGF